jgi:hypothetical protein
MRWTIEKLRPELRAQVEGKLSAISKKRNKYNAIPTEINGLKFGSKHEASCYCVLENAQKLGYISGLRTQVKFSLFDPGGHCRGEHIGTYKADFVFIEGGGTVVADAKSEATKKRRDWPRTKALMLACHEIHVREL